MKKYLLVVLAIGLVLALSGCDQLGEWLISATFESRAKVENEAGEPLADITVELIKDGTVVSTQVSDVKGEVGFGDTSEGTYTIRAAETGYVTFEKEVAISKLAQFLGFITMVELAFEPYIHVVDNSGNNLQGATVTLTDSSDVAVTETTDIDGSATFDKAEWNGTYALLVSKTDYASVSMNVELLKTARFLGKISLSDEVLTITGKVIDAKIDPDTDNDGTPDEVNINAIAAATVTLLDDSGTELASVDSATDGTFSFTVDSGTYTITAAKDNCAFIEETVEVFDEDLDMGELLGFEAPDEYTISIITVWSDDYADVDAYLTYPDAYLAGTTTPQMLDPYVSSGLTNGFEPDLSGSREKIYHNNKTSTNTMADIGLEGTDPVVELDSDEKNGSGPETITIQDIPFDWYADGFEASADLWNFYNTWGKPLNALEVVNTPTDYNDYYAWVGVMEFYVNGYDSDTDDTNDSNNNLMNEGEAGGADVTVYVTQGTEVKGRYTIPDYTKVTTAAVIRINMLIVPSVEVDESGNVVLDGSDPNSFLTDTATALFQILPDIKVYQDSSAIKGLNNSGALLLEGRTRTR